MLPSALFVELLAPVPVGVLNFNGCCHLGTELNGLRFRKLTFLARPAVTPTRRFAIHQIDRTMPLRPASPSLVS
ncbi:MAG TPA: hypothetical protein VM912_08805, partial [Terriglobales bacterium]|nr:hypothetical protein [Terriglobales bacterium]